MSIYVWGLTTWDWITNQRYSCLEKTNPPPSQQLLISYSFSYRSRDQWRFLIQVGMSTSIEINQVLFRQPHCWDAMEMASLSYIGDTVSRRAPDHLPLMTFSPLLPRCPLSLCVELGYKQCPLRLGSPQSVLLCMLSNCCFLQFPLYCKKKKFHLICFHKKEWFFSLSRHFFVVICLLKIQFKE